MIDAKFPHIVPPFRFCLIILMIGGLLFAVPPGAGYAVAQESKGERYISIDFDNIDITLFIKCHRLQRRDGLRHYRRHHR